MKALNECPTENLPKERNIKRARICWNSEGWLKPSGKNGKSMDKSSYECKYGFGHEEWLFDFDKLIDGLHYAAIQPIGKHQSKYANTTFDINLYSHNSETKEWYDIAFIKNVKVISNEEAERIYTQYSTNGWIDKMKQDLDDVKADSTKLDSFSEYVFNIKFDPKDIHFYNGNIRLMRKNEIPKHKRYTLLDNCSENNEAEDDPHIQINHNLHESQKPPTTIKRSFKAGTKEYEVLHNQIQDSFLIYLREQFPHDTISKEAPIRGINCNIDIYHTRSNDMSIIYEIKSYNDIKSSLRNALGQMLEYAYYSKRDRKHKLVLVTHKISGDTMKSYINNINKMFSMDIGYVGFDFNKRMIIDKYNCEFLEC